MSSQRCIRFPSGKRPPLRVRSRILHTGKLYSPRSGSSLQQEGRSPGPRKFPQNPLSSLITASCPHAADLLEIMPALVAYADASGVYRQMSQAYERWCDIRREDYLGRHYEEILPRLFGVDYLRLAASGLQQAFHGEKIGFETKLLNNQKSRDVKITYTPDRDENGDVRGVLVLVSDISDLKQAEERVNTSEERLRLAADASNMGCWDLDLVTNALAWSPVCYRVLCFE